MEYWDSLSLPKRKRKVEFKEDEDGEYADLPFGEVSLLIPEADIVGSEVKPLDESSLTGQLIKAAVLLPHGEELTGVVLSTYIYAHFFSIVTYLW